MFVSVCLNACLYLAVIQCLRIGLITAVLALNKVPVASALSYLMTKHTDILFSSRFLCRFHQCLFVVVSEGAINS